MIDTEFDYLLAFVKSGEFWGAPCCFQLRSLWTAYCLHANIDVDTAAYDNQLMQLWEALTAPSWASYDCFDQFMCGYLV